MGGPLPAPGDQVLVEVPGRGLHWCPVKNVWPDSAVPVRVEIPGLDCHYYYRQADIIEVGMPGRRVRNVLARLYHHMKRRT